MEAVLTHLMVFLAGVLFGGLLYWAIDRDQLRDAADTGEFHLDDEDYAVIKRARPVSGDRRRERRRKRR